MLGLQAHATISGEHTNVMEKEMRAALHRVLQSADCMYICIVYVYVSVCVGGAGGSNLGPPASALPLSF